MKILNVKRTTCVDDFGASGTLLVFKQCSTRRILSEWNSAIYKHCSTRSKMSEWNNACI